MMSSRRISQQRGSGITCPACGTPNQAGAEVCIECLGLLGEASGGADAGLGDWQPPARNQRKRSTTSRATRGVETSRTTRQAAPRYNRAAVIRQQVRQAQPIDPGQPKKKSWWNDWRIGALAMGALSLIGLRRSNIGENLSDTLSDLPNNVEQWIDDNVI
jgi:hypothetical protein